MTEGKPGGDDKDARIAELEAALKPFAETADRLLSGFLTWATPKDWKVDVMVEDCFKAKAVLERTQRQG